MTGGRRHEAGSAAPSAARADELLSLADWMTEDVAQRLYAARQDLSDVAYADAAKRPDVEVVNDQLLAVIRSLHDIAGVLRAGADEARHAPGPDRLATDVRDSCAAARELITQSLALVGRSIEIRGREALG